MIRVLVIDDQSNMRTTLALMLNEMSFAVATEADGETACRRLDQEHFDVVLTDLKMEGWDGLRVLEQVKERRPEAAVILMTAYGTVKSAVSAMRAGAADYIEKPFSEEVLKAKIHAAVATRPDARDPESNQGAKESEPVFDGLIGESARMLALKARILRVARSNATVLICGESGTGKEVVARAIHAHSRRSHKPLVPVNCAAFTETLIDSELFGHSKGAFTGANGARRGLFEEACGSTFFFDEITETPVSFQAKLLRAIQEGEIRPLGDNLPRQVDVRVIAATNENLEEAIAARRFRKDLYYRLNVVRCDLPPLRERRGDIPLLCDYFLDKHRRHDGGRARLTPAVVDGLMTHDFPGNVRELENLIEQGVALSEDALIDLDDLDMKFSANPARAVAHSPPHQLSGAVNAATRAAIEAALVRADGNREQAASHLGLSPTTLWRRMKKLGITWPI